MNEFSTRKGGPQERKSELALEQEPRVPLKILIRMPPQEFFFAVHQGSGSYHPYYLCFRSFLPLYQGFQTSGERRILPSESSTLFEPCQAHPTKGSQLLKPVHDWANVNYPD